MVIEITSLAELQKFAKKLAALLKGGEILALTGNLGAGKTTFTKMLLKEAGIRHNIVSPTFVLMIPYEKRGAKKSCTFYHMDLYRLQSYKDVSALGVPDLWGKKENIFIIEWADKIKRYLPAATIHLSFKVTKDGRKITIKNAKKDFKI